MTTKKDNKKSKKRNWVKLKAEYCTTKISIRGMAKKYGIPYSTVNSRCTKEGWAKDKEEVLREIDQKVEQETIKNAAEKEIDKRVKANEIHTELYDKGLEVAGLLLDKYLTDLKSGKKKTQANAYNLDFIMKAIKNAQSGQRVSLNIDKNNDIITEEPDVVIVEGIDIEKI